MAKAPWKTKRLTVASLLLDEKNPRLGRETGGRAPREIVQYLFDHDKAMDVARSIASRGYFENEPLLAIVEDGHHVVVEGNRRLAALKALREPGLLDGKQQKQVERLGRQTNLDSLARVPVTIAPNRRATDRLLAGRHIGTPVLAWQAENRASFILSKLEEGYDNDDLRDELGFSEQDIQDAKQTRAIAEMARALDLPVEVKAKIDNPRVKVFSTLERVFDSSVGRAYLKVEPDPQHGLRGITTKQEFMRAFAHLVTDIALQHETSRSLNTNENIQDYFEQRNPSAVAGQKRGKFLPGDIIPGKTVTSPKVSPTTKRTKAISQTVVPSTFKVRYGNDRLADIRRELIRLKRPLYPNAGAVLLRVFLELAVRDYLERTGRLEKIKKSLDKKGKLPQNKSLTMRHMAGEITAVAKKYLTPAEATMVEKALRHDLAAPFSISDLHAFIHHTDFPGERDILQFWNRTEPLFRLMLERDPKDSSQ